VLKVRGPGGSRGAPPPRGGHAELSFLPKKGPLFGRSSRLPASAKGGPFGPTVLP